VSGELLFTDSKKLACPPLAPDDPPHDASGCGDRALEPLGHVFGGEKDFPAIADAELSDHRSKAHGSDLSRVRNR
jgi:hypothetical protein